MKKSLKATQCDGHRESDGLSHLVTQMHYTSLYPDHIIWDIPLSRSIIKRQNHKKATFADFNWI